MIEISYRTHKTVCGCCGQKLESPVHSDIRKYKITDDLLDEYFDWKEALQYEDDITSLADEFIFETISFFSLNTYESLELCEGELEKLIKYIEDKYLNETI